MVLEEMKQYPSQIVDTFKRFPAAIAFALISTLSLIYLCNNNELFQFVQQPEASDQLNLWLTIYPISAVFISLMLTLLKEARGKLHTGIQVIVHIAWFAFAICVAKADIDEPAFGTSIALFVLLSITSVFTVPFFKYNNDLTLWNFLRRTIKSVVVTGIISVTLCAVLCMFLTGFFALFNNGIRNDYIYMGLAIICATFIAPLLFLTSVPTKGDLALNQPLHRFSKNVIHFFFIPVLVIYVLMLYAYIVKLLVQWTLPLEEVTAFVSISMLLMLIITTILYPAHFELGLPWIPGKRNSSPRNVDKFLLKALPVAISPLLILLAIGTFGRFAKYGITTSRLYLLYFTFWCYAATVIALCSKNKKIWWMITSAYGILFISLIGPFSATSISMNSSQKKIMGYFAQEGYTDYPLDSSQYKAFIDALQEKDSDRYEKFIEQRDLIQYEFGEKMLAKFFPQFSSERPPMDENVAMAAGNGQEPLRLGYSSGLETMEAIPEGSSSFRHVSFTLGPREASLQGDTLEFGFSISDTPCDGNCPELSLRYRITMDELRTLTPPENEDEGAPATAARIRNLEFHDSATTLIPERFTLEVDSEGPTVKLSGILFTK